MRIITRLKSALGASVIASMLLGSAYAAEPTPTPVDPAEQFKVLSAKAETAFQARQYQAAVDAYLEAYGVFASPDVLYNIAYIYDHHLQKTDLAQDFYRRVIRMPDSSKEILELSMKRLAELEAKDNARATVLRNNGGGNNGGGNTNTGNNTGVGTRLEKPDEGPNPAPWVLIGLGGASIIAAGVLGVMAQDTNDEHQGSGDLDDMRRLEDEGRTQALAADILGIGGGVLIATGIIVHLVSDNDEPKTVFAPPPVRPMLGNGAIGLSWETSL